MLRRIALALAVLGLAGSAASLAAGAGVPAFPSSGTHWAYSWHDTPTGSDASLRGVSAVSASTAWSSGSGGTVLRTVDRGATWQQVGPPDTELLQFRDIEAFDANRAVILSVGFGGDSRIYVTSDAGQSWTLAFENDDPNAFYDCMTFFDDGAAWRCPILLTAPSSGSSPRPTAARAGTSSIRPECRRPWRASSPLPRAGSASCPTTAVAPGSAPAAAPRPGSSARTTAARPGVSARRRCSAARAPASSPSPSTVSSAASQWAETLRRRPPRQLRVHQERRQHVAARAGRSAGIPIGRRLGRRPLGDRGRAAGQRRQHQRRHDLAALRRRQPAHDRLREPERLLGLRGRRARRVSRPLAPSYAR